MSHKSLLGKQLRPHAAGGVCGTAELNQLERDREFISKVHQALEGGLLRYSRRLELLDLAKQMGINRFEATLMIARVQCRNGDLPLLEEPEDGADGTDLTEAHNVSRRSELYLKAVAVLVIVALADLIIVRVLFG